MSILNRIGIVRLRIGKSGGKERGGFPESINTCLVGVGDSLDPLTNQLRYLAGETERVKDDGLAGELGKLHPESGPDAIQSMVGRVLAMRHPEGGEPPSAA